MPHIAPIKGSCYQLHRATEETSEVSRIRCAAFREAYAIPGRIIALENEEDNSMVASETKWLYVVHLSQYAGGKAWFTCVDIPTETFDNNTVRFDPDTTSTQELIRLINEHARGLDEKFGK